MARVLFWHDVWCGDRSLKTQFPNLFRMARHKNAMVHDVIFWNGNVYHWNLTFVRSLNDWEEGSICSLLALLASKEVFPKEMMSLYGLSIVKVLSLLRVFVPLRWKRRGVGMVQPKVPTKACFFVWATSKGKIPTEDKLKRRNFSGPSRCSLVFGGGRISGSSPCALSVGLVALGFISLFNGG